MTNFYVDIGEDYAGPGKCIPVEADDLNGAIKLASEQCVGDEMVIQVLTGDKKRILWDFMNGEL